MYFLIISHPALHVCTSEVLVYMYMIWWLILQRKQIATSVLLSVELSNVKRILLGVHHTDFSACRPSSGGAGYLKHLAGWLVY